MSTLGTQTLTETEVYARISSVETFKRKWIETLT